MAMSETVLSERALEGWERLAGKYLTFRLANEEFGLQILVVREIIGLMDITTVPRTPDWVRGVINLRGKVIPVVDLRVKFGMASVEDTASTCIIVVEVTRGEDALPMGVVVDEVSEVRDVVADQIDPTPAFGAAVDTEFILGMGKVGQTVVMLLDIDRVLNDSELAAVEAVTS
ncbi:MAG: purine-binding chemotaxis protein CheW [Fimbriimonadaceae bacterium]|nr:purine-binding chemotaxis protein CheW [Fimbriimonadaceae bacterium]